jgi:hypothetical protein
MTRQRLPSHNEVGAGAPKAFIRPLGLAALCLLVDACASAPSPQNPFLRADAAAASAGESVAEPDGSDTPRLPEDEQPPFQARIPIEGLPAASASPARQTLPVELTIERARATVLELGRARWTNGRQATSRALSALADVLVAADASEGLVAEVRELRFQAERLSRTDTSSLGEAGWVKNALTAALQGLNRVGGEERGASSKWSPAARQAVASIEERSTINLQRAAVQDAFRATTDAFAAELSLTDVTRP